MAELVRTILSPIAIIVGLFGEGDTPYHVTDRSMTIIEGSIGAIQINATARGKPSTKGCQGRRAAD